MAQVFSGMSGQMSSMYVSMGRGMVEGTLQALEQPLTIDRLALFMHSYYEALIRQGFTKEEALQIVVRVGIPVAPASK
jgi:hypothetical protein